MNMNQTRLTPWASRSAMALAAALVLSTTALPARSQAPTADSCGVLSNGANGPFDYRKPDRLLTLAEQNHFTPKVEALLSGQSRVEVGGDLSFILVMFPNHARALMAMMRLGEKEKTEKPRGAGFEVECYFERALRFMPDDNVARMIYVVYLTKKARQTEALQHLQFVVDTAGDRPFTHYNAGLLYFDLKEYDKAAAQARAAQAGGLLRPDLIDKLKALGKWREPDAAPAAAASAAAPS